MKLITKVFDITVQTNASSLITDRLGEEKFSDQDT